MILSSEELDNLFPDGYPRGSGSVHAGGIKIHKSSGNSLTNTYFSNGIGQLVDPEEFEVEIEEEWETWVRWNAGGNIGAIQVTNNPNENPSEIEISDETVITGSFFNGIDIFGHDHSVTIDNSSVVNTFGGRPQYDGAPDASHYQAPNETPCGYGIGGTIVHELTLDIFSSVVNQNDGYGVYALGYNSDYGLFSSEFNDNLTGLYFHSIIVGETPSNEIEFDNSKANSNLINGIFTSGCSDLIQIGQYVGNCQINGNGKCGIVISQADGLIANISNSTTINSNGVENITLGDGISCSGHNSIITLSHSVEVNENHGNGVRISGDDNEFYIRQESSINDNDFSGLRLTGGIVIDVRWEYSGNTVTVDSSSQVCGNLGLEWRGARELGNGIYLSILDETTVEVLNQSMVSNNSPNGIYGFGLLSSNISVDTQSEVNENEWSGILIEGTGPKSGPQISQLNTISVTNSECNANEGIVEIPGEIEENIGGIVAVGDKNEINVENSTVQDNGWFGVRNLAVGEQTGSATIHIGDSDILDNGYTGVSIYRVKDLQISDSQIDGCGNIGVYAGRESYEVESVFNVDISNTSIGEITGNGSHGICLERGVRSGFPFGMATNVNLESVQIDNSGLLDPAASGIKILDLADIAWVGGASRRYDEDSDIHLEDVEINNSSETCLNGLSFDGCGYLQAVIDEVTVDCCPVGILLQYTNEAVTFDETLNLVLSGFWNTSQFEVPSQIGLFSDHCSNLRLHVLPPSESNNYYDCYFYNQSIAGIVIDSDNAYPPRISIDGATFAVTTGVPRNPTHIKFTGSIHGWDDEDNPVNYGCISKCRFLDGNTGIELADDQEGDPVVWYQPNAKIVNNAFLYLSDYGVKVNFHGLDEGDNIITRIANNTFRGDQIVAVNIGIYENNLEVDPESAVFNDIDQIFNNIFDHLGVGIYQENEEADEPLYKKNCFFGNVVNCENCFEAQSIFEDPRFSTIGTSDVRLDWRSPCINAGLTANENSPWPNETTVINGIEYTTPTDIGCTGGPYSDILYANIMPTGTELDDEADDGVPWIDSDNNTANLPPDDYEVWEDFTITSGYHLIVNPNTTFLMGDQFFVSSGASIDVAGSVEIEEEDEPRVYFGPRFSDWNRIYVWNPSDNCTFDGCTVTDATTGIYYQGSTTANGIDMTISNCDISNMSSYGIYCYNPSGNGEITNTTVDNCGYYGVNLKNTGVNLRSFDLTDITITNAGSRGLSILDNVQVLSLDGDEDGCSINISDCAKQGVYLNGNYLNPANRSSLEQINVTNCNTNGSSTTEAGIYVYESNPLITACFVHDNFDYGIYVTNTSDPAIDGVDNQHANNILNNGNPGSQTTTLGAEIRLADYNSMEAGGFIQYINMYDIRDGNRDGKIASKSGSDALNIDRFYFGNGRAADWAASDLYASSNPWTTTNDNGNTPYTPDEWENVDSDEEYPDPANTFEEGIAAMKAGEFSLAVTRLWEWIAEEPASHRAASAVHAILRSERARESNLDMLRATFLSLADTSENYPELAWMARRMAVKCLIYNGDREDGREEYESMRALAPSIIDSLFLELDILFLQEDNDGAHVASLDDREAKLNDRIEELLDAGETQGREIVLPSEFELSAAYPNPFNASVRIDFTLPAESLVRLNVYSSDGRLVGSILDGTLKAGHHKSQWTSPDLPTGLYFLKMEACGQIKTQKMVLVK